MPSTRSKSLWACFVLVYRTDTDHIDAIEVTTAGFLKEFHVSNLSSYFA